ncbi:hypothetical protein T265_04623 [Opisthorchis viverrini]|uniref:Peptidase A2 domain-containing protein n=1 Tax=Opisthorchis viverrini TaxID=6198 RepID=A0A075AGB0_OPIVI|nr:hypothetical protein T265_04623 [Opisthorchis viverrini]KER28579.1 hypothetical protein T265_04623 [Opisthorchis viverrini]
MLSSQNHSIPHTEPDTVPPAVCSSLFLRRFTRRQPVLNTPSQTPDPVSYNPTTRYPVPPVQNPTEKGANTMKAIPGLKSMGAREFTYPAEADPTPHVQTILASIHDSVPLAGLASIADKILEIQPCSANVFSVNTSDSVSALHDRLDQLADQVAAIRINRHQPFRRPPFRSRSTSRSHSSSREQAFCWYHSTFGHRARKCSQPCSFRPNYPTTQSTSANSRAELEASKVLNPTHITRRLTIIDKPSGLKSLVDPGSDISIIPVSAVS